MRRVYVFCIFILLFLGGCAALTTRVSLPLDRSEKTLSLTSGQAFSIILDSNPTTGYAWQLIAIPDPAIVRLESRDFIPSSSSRLGAAGEEVWRFRTIGPGYQRIEFHYIRAFEEKGSPIETRAVYIKVITEKKKETEQK
ncbi:MAG: protease inhibitor I42 family protein [Candidatus Ratteibacteria bacterium]|jgi:predicted secreted protein